MLSSFKLIDELLLKSYCKGNKKNIINVNLFVLCFVISRGKLIVLYLCLSVVFEYCKCNVIIVIKK